MELKDIQKKTKDVTVTGRVTKEDKKFIDERNINVGQLIRISIENLRKGENEVMEAQE